jgi:hypothetical protein
MLEDGHVWAGYRQYHAVFDPFYSSLVLGEEIKPQSERASYAWKEDACES